MGTRGHYGLLLNSGGAVITNDFSNAILALSPMFYTRLNDTSGSTADNIGSGGDGGYSAGVALNRGALVNLEANANSVQFDASGEIMRLSSTVISTAALNDADWKGVYGFVYAGTGGGSHSSVRVFGRQASGNLYVRADVSSHIAVRTGSAAEANTGVSGDVLKDGNPHFIMIAKVSDGVTHDSVRLYVDGSQIWSSNQTITVNTNEFQLGNNYNNNQYTYGRYAEFFWSKGNYSQAQIDAINNAWIAQ